MGVVTTNWREHHPIPIPNKLMFQPSIDGKSTFSLMNEFRSGVHFPDASKAVGSVLATRLFQVPGVTQIYFGPDYVSVTKDENSNWEQLRPEVSNIITEFFTN